MALQVPRHAVLAPYVALHVGVAPQVAQCVPLQVPWHGSVTPHDAQHVIPQVAPGWWCGSWGGIGMACGSTGGTCTLVWGSICSTDSAVCLHVWPGTAVPYVAVRLHVWHCPLLPFQVQESLNLTTLIRPLSLISSPAIKSKKGVVSLLFQGRC